MSGGIAGRGRPGSEGPQGPMGPTGPQGPAAFTLAIGEVAAVPYGGTPSVVNTGTDQDQVWDISVPTGATGVLTGASLPSGADGTSLGQLYFCTTNQTYYGLVELKENDNKWRPIMTQDNSIRRYTFDVVQHIGSAEKDHTGAVCGTFSAMFDDVAQKLAVNAVIQTDIPIRGSGSALATRLVWYVDADVHHQFLADCVLRGISAVPVTVDITVNGITTQYVVDLMHEGTSNVINYMKFLSGIMPVAEGTGSVPGAVPQWKDGALVLDENRTGAPSSSIYGDISDLPRGSDVAIAIWQTDADEEYTKLVRINQSVVIPYA